MSQQQKLIGYFNECYLFPFNAILFINATLSASVWQVSDAVQWQDFYCV